MTKNAKSYEEYQGSSPLERTVQRLIGASEVVAALGLSVVEPGAEPWVLAEPSKAPAKIKKKRKERVAKA